MPNRDGTGPEGKGPRTGRQMGNCEGAEPREITKRFFFGRRLGRGFGRGFRRRINRE